MQTSQGSAATPRSGAAADGVALGEGRIDAALLDAMPERIAVLDQAGTIVVANAAWRRTCAADHGAPSEGASYRDSCTASSVGPDGDHATVIRLNIQRILDGANEPFSLEYPCKSGRDRWCRVEVAPVRGERMRALVRHHDVVGAHDADARRAASEALFRLSVDESTDAIVLHELGGRIVDLNAGACRHFGYAREELLGQEPCFFDKGYDQARKAEIERLLASGESCIFESEHTRKDGTTVPVEVRMRPFGVEGQHFAVSITHDISERKRAEARLREALDRMEKMAARLPGFVYQYRRAPGGGIAFGYASEGIRDMFGITPEEAYADPMKVFEKVHPEDRAALEETARKSKRTLQPWHLVFRIAREGAPDKWVAGTAVPEREPDGITLWHGFVTDITEQRRANVALRLAAAGLQSISQGVVIIAAEGEILYANPAFTAITGFTSDELVGKRSRVLLDRLDPALVKRLLATVNREQVFNEEILDLRKDGTRFWNELAIAPVRDDDGKVTHFVCVARDVTPRKEAEAELREHREQLEALVRSRTAELASALDAAEAANRAKTTFLANMSHELRTPMTGIMGMTDLALRRATDALQIDYLRKSAKASRHLLAIINDILDLSRIEADRLLLDPQDFDVRDLVAETLRMQNDAAREKGLALGYTVDASVPSRLRADPLRLRQILLNYVSNAVKFSERGRIVVRVSLTGEANDPLLRMEVEDEGIGIPLEQQSLLFKPFTQADESTTRLYGGTGLGLAISRRLARLMGGDTGCVSAAGRGSTFWMTARVARAAPEQPASDAGDPDLQRVKAHAGRRVLVADDQPLTQEVVRLLLEAAGLTADVVDNGAEAVARASYGDYALVLMDIHMPVMDGLDATRAIRRLPECRDLPIVAMTAAVFEEDRARAKAAGMNGHLAKPVSPESLWPVLLQFLDSPTGA